MSWQIGDTIAAWRTRNATTFAPTTPPVVGASAPVTAYDAVTGRLQIGGIEIGDTGWREVSSLMNPTASGWTGSLYLRRVGSNVYLSTQGAASINGVTATDNRPLDLVQGFRGWRHSSVASLDVIGTVIDTDLVFKRALLSKSSGTGTCDRLILANGTAACTYKLSLQWTTMDVWPTSLPGTAA